MFFLRRWGDDVTFYDASIVSNVEVGLFEGRSSVTYTWKEVDPEFSTWNTQCAIFLSNNGWFFKGKVDGNSQQFVFFQVDGVLDLLKVFFTFYHMVN